MFKALGGKLSPFERDKLLLSIYNSCNHRKSAQTDASALTDTVLSKLRGTQPSGVIDRPAVISTVLGILQRFDTAAAVHYEAHHRS
jgi:transcriptional regulator NrdR family protein